MGRRGYDCASPLLLKHLRQNSHQLSLRALSARLSSVYRAPTLAQLNLMRLQNSEFGPLAC